MATDKDVSGKVIEAVENRNRRFVGSWLAAAFPFLIIRAGMARPQYLVARLIGLMDSKWRGGGRCKSLLLIDSISSLGWNAQFVVI